MTSNDTFGRDLSRWLIEDGEHRVPDHLGEVLVRTAATRQRPWWSSPERWLPMDTVAPARTLGNLRPTMVVLLVIALILAALGAAYVASRPSTAPAWGLAENGRIYVPTGDTITSFAADGTDPQAFLDVPGGAMFPSISPDGLLLAFRQGPGDGTLKIAPLAGGDPVTVTMPDGIAPGEQTAWSPDSKSIAFPAFDGSQEFLYTARADGTGASRVGGDAIPETTAIWWPAYSPDGEWISFIGIPNGAGQPPAPGELYLIHPDGTGLHSVASGVHPDENSNSAWSPDPARPRLLFARNGVELYDVATEKVTALGLAFWPSWSPDGSRIAAWQDGVVVADPDAAPISADEYVRAHPSFTGTCGEHPELAGKAVCSTVSWSPDGTRLLGIDIAGGGIVSLPSDGQGEPVLLPAQDAESGAWQPVR